MENKNLEVVNEEVVENTETTEEVVVEAPKLFTEDSEYREMALKARELGMSYVGMKKEELMKAVNDMLIQISNGEIEAPTAEEETSEEEESTSIPEATTEAPASPAQAAAQKAARKKTERTPRQAAKKWYEEPGAFPYSSGDVVEIVGGKDLIGRMLHVLEPSAKKDMVKGKLVHPVTGKLQNTVIAIAFDRIELREKAGEDTTSEEETTTPTNQEEVTNETPTEEVVPETNEETSVEDVEETPENLTDGAEEELSIPELTVEEEVEEEVAE